MNQNYIVAITGASGSIYGIRLIQALLKAGCYVNLVISDTGKKVILHETGLDFSDSPASITNGLNYFGENNKITLFDNHNLFSTIASGSTKNDGMIVVPCSMGSLSRLASGNSQNLLERTADVMLKEKRPLILVPRETPLNQIHLENMLKLAKMNVDIVPAMPAFYQKPKNMDDLVDFVVGKVLDLLKVEHQLFERWNMNSATINNNQN